MSTDTDDKTSEKRRKLLAWLIATAFAIALLLVANMWRGDSQTRPAVARDGGVIIETGIVPAAHHRWRGGCSSFAQHCRLPEDCRQQRHHCEQHPQAESKSQSPQRGRDPNCCVGSSKART